MDLVTVAQGLVRVLVDYLRTPLSDRPEFPGAASADRALRFVAELMQTGGERFAEPFAAFEKEPTTSEEVMVRLLVQLLSDNPVAAEQVTAMLSQCQRERNASIGKVVEQRADTVKYGGIATGSQDVSVGGDIRGLTIGGVRQR